MNHVTIGDFTELPLRDCVVRPKSLPLVNGVTDLPEAGACR